MATKTTPTLSTETDWRSPKPSDKTTRHLASVPHNGDWYVINEALGQTVAEQKARILNHGSTDWEWGFRVYALDRELVSDLAVRWVGK